MYLSEAAQTIAFLPSSARGSAGDGAGGICRRNARADWEVAECLQAFVTWLKNDTPPSVFLADGVGGLAMVEACHRSALGCLPLTVGSRYRVASERILLLGPGPARAKMQVSPTTDVNPLETSMSRRLYGIRVAGVQGPEGQGDLGRGLGQV